MKLVSKINVKISTVDKRMDAAFEMAASTELSSPSWVSSNEDFAALLSAGITNIKQLENIVSPECIEMVFKGCKQFNFWSRKLYIDNQASVLTLTLMKDTGLAKPNIPRLQEEIVSIIGPGRIESINYPENSNFVTIVFKDSEAGLLVRNGLSVIDGSLACFVPNKPINSVGIRILWTPLFYKIEGLIKTLSKWCEKIEIAFEKESFKNGEVIANNRASGIITFKENESLKTLPHIVRLAGSKENYVLLVIKERPPLCLRCKREGHIRRTCDQAKCLKCLNTHSIYSSCAVKSFVSVVRNFNKTCMDEKYLITDTNGEKLNSSVLGKIDKGIGSTVEASNVPKVREKLNETSEMSQTSTNRELDKNNSDFQLVTKRGTRALKRKISTDKNLTGKEVCKDKLMLDRPFFGLIDEMDLIDNEAPEVIHDTVFENKDLIKYSSDEDTLKGEASSSSSICDILPMEENLNRGIEDYKDCNESINNISNEKVEVMFTGFPNNNKIKQISEFLGDLTPIDTWYYTDENDKPDGTFGAVFGTEEEARAALHLHGKTYKGKEILIEWWTSI